MPDDLNAKLSAIEQSGKARFGETDWNVSMEALRKVVPAGIPPAEMAQIAGNSDPAGLLMTPTRKSGTPSENDTAEYKGRVWQQE